MYSSIKNIIREIDNFIFCGTIRKIYRSFFASDYSFLEHKWHYIKNVGIRVTRSKIIELPVSDFILMQFHSYDIRQLERIDLAARYLALEQYDQKNRDGIALDNLIQEKWVGKDWEIRFRNLIDSVREKGFDTAYPIEADKNLHLIDGSHRTTIALYNNIEFVKVRINNCEFKSGLGMDSLWGFGLRQEQLERIEIAAEKILQKSRYPFVCILWPPVRNYFDKITQELTQFKPENISVMRFQDIKLDRRELEGFFKAVYFTDDITPNALRSKIEAVISASQQTDGLYDIRLLWLDILFPYYRVKPVSGFPQSRETMICKEAFRNRYKDLLENYKRDIIIHITDNYLQSKFISSLLEINTDIHDLFPILNEEILYAVFKEDLQSVSFPYRFAFRTDLDILVPEKSFSDACQLVFQYALRHFTGEWLEVADESDKENGKIRIKMRGFSVFLFHIQKKASCLKDSFIDECLQARVQRNGYYLFPSTYEIIFRIGEYYKYPEKKHHGKYIRSHRDSISGELLDRAFPREILRKIKKMLDKI